MIVGAVANPRDWGRWPEAEALLEPARVRGDFQSVLEHDEVLYVVLDRDNLLAAATAWLSVDGYVEVKLIGGRDHRRWLHRLDETIGADAKAAGAARMIGIGRKGWGKALTRLGWVKLKEVEDHWLFSRDL